MVGQKMVCACTVIGQCQNIRQDYPQFQLLGFGKSSRSWVDDWSTSLTAGKSIIVLARIGYRWDVGRKVSAYIYHAKQHRYIIA